MQTRRQYHEGQASQTMSAFAVVFHPAEPLVAHLANSCCVAVWEIGTSKPHITLCGDCPIVCIAANVTCVIGGRVDGVVSS